MPASPIRWRVPAAVKNVGKLQWTSVHADDLVEYSQLQEWQKDNEYILTGYRQVSSSFSRSLSSVFGIHNETVNIWSHGIGFIGYSLIPLVLFQITSWRESVTDFSDNLALAIFFASVTICFIFSSCFHTFLNHSPNIWYLMSQLDHLGIVIVIWGSAVSSVHFGFRDNPGLRDFYWNLATASGLLAGIGTMHPKFRTPAGRKLRFLFYCLLGCTTFLSAFHGVRLYTFNEQSKRMGLEGFIGLGLLNFTGAAIYAARIPERWYPRVFDIYGASHQLMHILVACGALSHALGLISAAHYWRALPQ